MGSDLIYATTLVVCAEVLAVALPNCVLTFDATWRHCWVPRGAGVAACGRGTPPIVALTASMIAIMFAICVACAAICVEAAVMF